MTEWASILVALLIAVGVSLALVGLLGWRRPGVAHDESVVTSAVFWFVIVFLATWALGAWIVPVWIVPLFEGR